MTAAAEGERADSWHACRKAGQVTLAESATPDTDVPPALRPRSRTPPARWREHATGRMARPGDAAHLDASEEDVTPGCQQQ